MANIKIRRYSGSSIDKAYVVKGALLNRDRLSQPAPALPLPFSSPAKTILTNIIGQAQTITLDFIILPRDSGDDWTDGTDTPTYGLAGMKAQREYLKEEIFKPTGDHSIVDVNGEEIVGRITDMEITQQGDDPVQDSVSITFSRGVTLI